MQGYKGVRGPVRKAVGPISADAYERFVRGDATAIPLWMRPAEGDSAKTKEKKQKALKAFKKKLRCV